MTEDCQKSKRQQFRPDENRHKIGSQRTALYPNKSMCNHVAGATVRWT